MVSYHTCPLASQEGKETGGMNVYVLELSKRLAEQGHWVDIYTRCQDPSNQKVVQVAPRLRLLHLLAGPASYLPKKELAPFLDAFIQKMTEFMAEEQLEYDAWHAHYYYSGLVGLSLREKWLGTQPAGRKFKSKTTPLIMTFHTLALMKNLVGRDEGEKEDSPRVAAENLLVQQVDQIIAPSLSDQQYLQYLYQASSSKITVVPPGVDTQLFRPLSKKLAREVVGLLPKQKMLLFVGRIEPQKGLIHSCMHLKSCVSGVQPKHTHLICGLWAETYLNLCSSGRGN